MERDKKVNKLYHMSDKEIRRLQVMTQLEKKQITNSMAAEQLGINIRQVKRLKRGFQEQGADGLINKSRGKPSHNQLKAEVKQQVLDLILERYSDFGPTLASEKLREVHGIQISDESVRKIMLAEDLWKHRRRQKARVFQMRQRRACLGELVQIDGSDYDWFEGRSPRCTLLVFVDDATGGNYWSCGLCHTRASSATARQPDTILNVMANHAPFTATNMAFSTSTLRN